MTINGIKLIDEIAIVGAGNIGRVCAYYLDSNRVTIVSRRRLTEPLTIVIDDKIQNINGKIVEIGALDLASIKLLIVAIKSYHNNDFISAIKHKTPKALTFLIMQNGISFIDQFISAFPDNPLVAGLSTDGAFKNADGSVTLAGQGRLMMGNIQNAAKMLVAPLLEKHPDPYWVEDINTAIFQKLIVNVVINSITFLKECKNGAVIHYKSDVDMLIAEVIKIYQGLNIHIDSKRLRDTVYEVIAGTAENQSSMLQDRLNKRQTEVEAIQGALIRKAQAIGQVPTLLIEYYKAIKKIEADYLVR